ncbi:hypothetical protein BD769DRAFT_1392695 [Suillus cothurnatus]|nr:hypothetical protein BD769DRAFT_1392695 [Suillus cothurnatus]
MTVVTPGYPSRRLRLWWLIQRPRAEDQNTPNDHAPKCVSHASETTGRQRTSQWSNAQRLHPYRDPRLTNPTTSSAPHTWSPVLSPEDLESAICQSETMMHLGRPDPPKISDYSPEEVEVIEFVHRRVVMDMITTKGWCKNSTKKHKNEMHNYMREVVNEVKVLLDYHEKECPPHYHDCLEPQDKSLSVEGRQQYMMEHRTVMCFIDRYVEGRLSRSGKVIRFASNAALVRQIGSDELILPSVAANTTSHNTVSHNTAPPFPISPQFQQRSPFVTWLSTPLYIQGSNSASIDNQSGQAPCSEVERLANMQSNIHTQFAQQSYLDFSKPPSRAPSGVNHRKPPKVSFGVTQMYDPTCDLSRKWIIREVFAHIFKLVAGRITPATVHARVDGDDDS